MSKEDLIRIEGKVKDATGGGIYQVLLENGTVISARLSGRMKKFKIRIIVGDGVTVGISPYDASHGLILHRHKEMHATSSH